MPRDFTCKIVDITYGDIPITEDGRFARNGHSGKLYLWNDEADRYYEYDRLRAVEVTGTADRGYQVTGVSTAMLDVLSRPVGEDPPSNRKVPIPEGEDRTRTFLLTPIPSRHGCRSCG